MAKPFSVVGGSPRPDHASMPAGLDKDGQTLWRDVLAEYDINDRGGLETLFQICAAKDMAARLRNRIDKDGEIVKTKTGFKEHPLLKAELAHRAFVVRGLHRLGLNSEPIKPMGRPPAFA